MNSVVSDSQNFSAEDVGGEIEIEKIPLLEIEIKRKDLLPVFDYFRQVKPDWNNRYKDTRVIDCSFHYYSSNDIYISPSTALQHPTLLITWHYLVSKACFSHIYSCYLNHISMVGPFHGSSPCGTLCAPDYPFLMIIYRSLLHFGTYVWEDFFWVTILYVYLFIFGHGAHTSVDVS